MKRGLKIENNFYLNMDAIISWRISSQGVSILTTLKGENNRLLITTSEPELGSVPYYFVVPVPEIKRIIQEISKYMGIES